MKGLAARAIAVLYAAMACGPAEAHLEVTGMGPVYDGLMHFLTSPEDLVPALALALLAGLRGAPYGRRAIFTLTAAWLLGSLGGLAAAGASGSPLGTAVCFLMLGGLVVADAKLSLRAMTALAAWLGLVRGYFDGTGLGPSAQAAVTVVGVVSALFVLVVLVAAFVVALRAPWARIAVRVGGSWIAASGIFVLGWFIRGTWLV